MKIEQLKPKDLRPDPNQPRKTFPKAEISSLAQNMKQQGIGVINPIEIDKDNMIVTGELRWRAAKEAKLSTVPVKRITVKSPEQRLLRQISENLHQVSASDFRMGDYDLAVALKHLLELEQKGLLGESTLTPPAASTLQTAAATAASVAARDKGYTRLAARLGVKREFIYRRIAMLGEDVPQEFAEAFQEGRISLSVATEVRSVQDEKDRNRLSKRVLEETKRAEESGEEARIDSHSVRAVKQRLHESQDAPTKHRIVNTLKAGVERDKVEERLRQVAPRESEAMEDVVRPGNDLADCAAKATAILRQHGSLEAFPPIQQQRLSRTLDQLNTALTDFLAASSTEMKKLLVEA